jgi:alpha-L-fucosidase
MRVFKFYIVVVLFLSILVGADETLPKYTTPSQTTQWLKSAKFGILFDWSAKVNFEADNNESYDHTVAKGLQKGSLYSIVKDKDDNPTGLRNWENWNPDKFNADKWIKSVVDAGARYFVYTVNDRYGFLNFDSPSTTLDIGATKWGGDICASLAKAANGKVAYFWRYQQHGGIDFILGGWIYFKSRWAKDIKTYAQYRKGNLYHLLRNVDLYGKCSGIYFTGNCGGVVPSEHPAREGEDADYYDQANSSYLSDLLEKQPWLAISSEFYLKKSSTYKPSISLDRFNFRNYNTNLNKPDGDHGVIFSLESDLDGWANVSVQDTRTSNEAIKLLALASGHNQNLLLRVTPDNRGEIPKRQLDVLDKVGAWLQKYGDSIYNTSNGPYFPATWGVSTRKNNVIYLHILQNSKTGNYSFEELPSGIKSVKLLNNNQTLSFTNQNGSFTFSIPDSVAKEHTTPDRVIEITYPQNTDTIAFSSLSANVYQEPISTNSTITANHTSGLRNRDNPPSILVEPLLDSKNKAAKLFYPRAFWSAPEVALENITNIYPVIVEIDFGTVKTFSQISILEKNRRIKKWRVEYLDSSNKWHEIYSADDQHLEFFDWKLEQEVSSKKVRLVVEESYGKAPQLRYFRVFN